MYNNKLQSFQKRMNDQKKPILSRRTSLPGQVLLHSNNIRAPVLHQLISVARVDRPAGFGGVDCGAKLAVGGHRHPHGPGLILGFFACDHGPGEGVAGGLVELDDETADDALVAWNGVGPVEAIAEIEESGLGKAADHETSVGCERGPARFVVRVTVEAARPDGVAGSEIELVHEKVLVRGERAIEKGAGKGAVEAGRVCSNVNAGGISGNGVALIVPVAAKARSPVRGSIART